MAEGGWWQLVVSLLENKTPALTMIPPNKEDYLAMTIYICGKILNLPESHPRSTHISSVVHQLCMAIPVGL